MDDALNTISEHVATLPKEIRSYISDSDWETAVLKIAGTFSLDQEQVSRLKIETAFVLCAVENITDFAENIRNGLHIPPNDAERITAAIVSQVITPVRNALEPLQDVVSAGQQAPAAASQPASPARPIGMLDDKLSSVIKLPSEETHYAEAGMKPEPSAPAQATAEQQAVQTPPAPPKPSYGPGQDPYREPPV